MLTCGSLFAGIGGFDLAADRCGLETRWQVEIDPFATRVLAKHWPGVRRYGDIRTVSGADLEAVDVVTGGFPCQGLSLAGQREGLADPRSGLFFDLVRVVRELREATHGRAPAFVVLENVPGLLSSNRGRDFAMVLRSLAELGSVELAWRILDARWWGVPQRRRRVFLVCDFRKHRAAQVLALAESGRRHPAPGRKARAETTRRPGGGPAPACRGDGPDRVTPQVLLPELAYTLAGGRGPARLQHEQTYVPVLSPALTAEGHDASEDGSGRRAMIAFHAQGGTHSLAVGYDTSPTLKVGHGNAQHQVAIAFAWQQGSDHKHGADGRGRSWVVRAGEYAGALSATRQDAVAYQCHGTNVGPAGTLRAGNGGLTGGVPFVAAPLTSGGHPHSQMPGRHREDDENLLVVNGNSTPEWREDQALALRHNDASGNRQWVTGIGTMIRRLTPTECERLMGLPDGHTCLCGVTPYSTWTCRCPDSLRYAACGNAVVTTVAEWLLGRIAAVLGGEVPC